MNNLDNFNPNWASKPGDTIADYLNDNKLDIDFLSKAIELSYNQASRLIEGYLEISDEIASKLALYIGGTSEFWLKRERQYRQNINSIRERENVWLKSLPIKDMLNLGWIKKTNQDLVSICLDFFEVFNIKEWEEKYKLELAMAAFRASKAHKTNPASVAAWLRYGEKIALNANCAQWNKKLFEQKLEDIKSLTKKKNPIDFLPKLIHICSECGVALVISKTPSGCRASGLTKFVTENKALLMLSFRYLTDDQFWFTFFHEVGHLLLHNKNAIFIENNDDNLLSIQEDEANNFSANFLIKKPLRNKLLSIPLTKRAIVKFAIEAGVSPGIVIGQMQYLGRVDYKRLNTYKRRYNWDDINTNVIR